VRAAPTVHEKEDVAPVATIVGRLRDAYPEAGCALTYTTPLDLLVATILAAQCTDERVNGVTATLFGTYRTAQDYADAAPDVLEAAVKSTGFYRNKARNIRATARLLVERHDGAVPRTMEELIALPGVARKTANVVLGNAHALVVGVAVDTHVGRVSRRLGLTSADDPVVVERDLMDVLPPDEWLSTGHRLIAHGRMVCTARKPRCAGCTLDDVCPSAGTFGAAAS